MLRKGIVLYNVSLVIIPNPLGTATSVVAKKETVPIYFNTINVRVAT